MTVLGSGGLALLRGGGEGVGSALWWCLGVASMLPRRRPKGHPAPVYGRGSTRFSLEIHHGGYFVGSACDRTYVDGHIIRYDDIEMEGWPLLIVEKMVKEIGYEVAGRMKIFYCIPMLTIKNNGLREIRDEVRTNFMITLVGIGQHYVKLYLDHEQSLDSMEFDDVVHFPFSELPTVVSPYKTPSGKQSELGSKETSPIPIQASYPIEEGSHIPIQTLYPTGPGTRRQSNRTRSSNISTDCEVSAKGESSEKAVSDSEEDDEDSDFEILSSGYVLSDRNLVFSMYDDYIDLGC